MFEGQEVPTPSPKPGMLRPVDPADEAQCARATLDLLAVYRRSMLELATENTMLREHVALLRLLATQGVTAEPG